MSTFTAIDFETATGDRASICQVGIVVVEQCKIIERIKHLVQPPNNLYHQRNIEVHGITPEQTVDAETFDKVYEKIKHHLEGKAVVAHNAKFDIDCLQKALYLYKIRHPRIRQWYCTRNIYKESLSIACAINGIQYKAHDALEDAEACAKLMIKDILR